MWSRMKTVLAALGGVLLAMLAGFVAGLRHRSRPLGPEIDRALESANRQAGEARATIEQERARAVARQRKAGELAERLSRLPAIVLLAIGVALIGPAASAEEPALPQDYETLAQFYLDAVDLAAQYKALYEEAEASNQRLLSQLEALQRQVEELTQTVRRQQELIERQQSTILSLLRGIRVAAGVSLDSLSPLSLAPWLAIQYEF